MKASSIKLHECPGYESVVKEQEQYFGLHFKNVVHDFTVTNQAFLIGPCNNPDLTEETLPQAKQALLNYFIYYCFGVANTVDPKSKFNKEYDSVKTDVLIKDIERMAEEQEGKNGKATTED